MKKTRVSLLDGGTLAINGFKLFWLRGGFDVIQFPVYSALIDHEDGLFLFDSGFDLEFMQAYTAQDNPLQTSAQTLPAQLGKVGLRPEDVTHVINSHLHIDHCGGNKYFPAATVVVHEREYEAAKNPYPFLYQSYSDLSFDPELHKLNVTGARDIFKRAGTPSAVPANQKPVKYHLVKGDVEFARGVWLFETPGHAAGRDEHAGGARGAQAHALHRRRRLRAAKLAGDDHRRLPPRPGEVFPVAGEVEGDPGRARGRGSSPSPPGRLAGLSACAGVV